MIFLRKSSGLCVLVFLSLSCMRARFPSYCKPPKEYEGRSSAEILKSAQEIIANGKEKRAIAYGLFGNKSKYVEGLIKDLTLAKIIFPGWDVVVFMHSETVPAEVVERVKAGGAKVMLDKNYNHASARFYIADLDYDRFIVRDVDSRLMHREMVAVADWIKNDWAILHGMRDTTAHLDPLLGGMWGAKTKGLREKLKQKFGKESVAELYAQFMKGGEAVYGTDQAFLAQVVVQAVGEDAFLSHETIKCNEFKNSRGFPLTRSMTGPFIGQVKEE
ncbi:MAG: hypothetical protein KA436_01255 [Oligoflexales bacterium]|nr:hypothetical protein [Oligoflexales bacterium]